MPFEEVCKKGVKVGIIFPRVNFVNQKKLYISDVDKQDDRADSGRSTVWKSVRYYGFVKFRLCRITQSRCFAFRQPIRPRGGDYLFLGIPPALGIPRKSSN